MTQIGFIGLGIMGSRMAQNLLNEGVSVTVWNRSAEIAHTLKGAIVAESPAALAQTSDIVFTMLPHPEAVRAVAFGENGILSHMRPGSLWVDCSTTYPTFAREQAATAANHNINFIEAPVAGSKNQANDGVLVFFAGGTESDVETAQPFFDIMGTRTIHVGESGMGISLKIVINHLLGTSIAAFAEALALGKSLGLSQETLLNSLIGGPVVPPYMAGKKAKIAEGEFSAEFPSNGCKKTCTWSPRPPTKTTSPCPSLPPPMLNSNRQSSTAKAISTSPQYATLVDFSKSENPLKRRANIEGLCIKIAQNKRICSGHCRPRIRFQKRLRGSLASGRVTRDRSDIHGA